MRIDEVSEKRIAQYTEQLTTLSNNLRRQAVNVESDGWLSAARNMNHAADQLEYLHSVLTKLDPNWQTTAEHMEPAVIALDKSHTLASQITND